jgi:hypothetical protein
MDAKWSRVWFGATVACVAAGVLISIFTAANSSTGHFPTSVERAFNSFAFFTIQSNLLIGVSSALLALNPARSSAVLDTLRLIGVVAITVTGIVFHVALARVLDLQGWDALGNQLVHTVVPILGLVGWLLFGPRGRITARVVWWSLLFPAFWLLFTLIRGAVIDWYPYPFIDVTKLGYGGTVLNCFWVALLLLALAAGARVLDRHLPDAAAGVTQANDLPDAASGVAQAGHSPVSEKRRSTSV